MASQLLPTTPTKPGTAPSPLTKTQSLYFGSAVRPAQWFSQTLLGFGQHRRASIDTLPLPLHHINPLILHSTTSPPPHTNQPLGSHPHAAHRHLHEEQTGTWAHPPQHPTHTALPTSTIAAPPWHTCGARSAAASLPPTPHAPHGSKTGRPSQSGLDPQPEDLEPQRVSAISPMQQTHSTSRGSETALRHTAAGMLVLDPDPQPPWWRCLRCGGHGP